MGFRKITYDGTEEIFEVVVKDGTGMVINKWKCMKRDFPNVMRILNDNYGLRLVIKKKDDLDWMR